MSRLILAAPELPEDRWFVKHCMSVIAGGDKELYNVLIGIKSN